MGRVADITGQRFGRWIVIDRAPSGPKGQSYWKCICDCGNQRIVDHTGLRRGTSQSCGCLKNELTIKRFSIHGMHKTPTYWAWSSMRCRCKNSNHEEYRNYGGRGITVCSRGDDFSNFLKDMGERPSDKHSIDRIDNSRGYTCGCCDECIKNEWVANCRWATKKEQQNNMRSNRFVSFNGVTHTISEWAEVTGIHKRTIAGRIDSGQSVERALTEKPRHSKPT